MTTVRIDRLEQVTDALGELARDADLEGMIEDDKLLFAVKVARRVGIDVLETLRGMLIDSLRRLPAEAAADPARADALAGWLVDLGAWLTGESDVEPGPIPLSASATAIGS